MNETTYRMIFEGLDEGAQLRKLIVFFQKELGLSEDTIRYLLTKPPRVLCEVSTQNQGTLMQQALSKIGCRTKTEPVVSHPSLPFVLSRNHYKSISQELSKILRVRASLALCLVQIEPAVPSTILPSLMGPLEEEIQNQFRESDTVLGIDDTRLIILGFSTDKDGIKYLETKTVRVLKELLGNETRVTMGAILFPQEGRNLPTLLALAENLRANNDTMPQKKSGKKSVANESSSPAHLAPTDTNSLQQSFIRARGKILQRLQGVSPEVLWLGLSQIPETKQREFLSRLPFDSPLAPALKEMIDTHCQPVSDHAASAQLQAVIHKLDDEGLNGHKDLQNKMQQQLTHVEALPTLPSIASHIFKMASNPESSARDLTKLIENDPPLTSKLLKIVNSAFYGFPQKIGNVNQAVVILGTDEIMDLSFGLAAAKVFDAPIAPGAVDPKTLWRHCMGTALISQKLCTDLPHCERLGGFTAGLLHDFGKIFILEHFAEAYNEIHEEFAQNGLPLFEIEEKWFGINHAKVGEALATHWNMPDPLIKAIAYHHQPFCAPSHSDMAALVGLADCLFHWAEAEPKDGETTVYRVPALLTVGHSEALSGFYKGFSRESITKLTEKAKTILEQNTHLFAILD